MAQLAAGLLFIAASQASDVVDRSTPQGFLSKYMSSGAAFAPRAAVPASRTVVFSGEDYASMDGPALAAAIDGKRKELFDMRLENRQGRQKTTFKSNVVRNLKRDIARMMPFLEAKQASSSPNMVLREQAQARRDTSNSPVRDYDKFITPTLNHVPVPSHKDFDSPKIADREEKQAAQKLLANNSYSPISLAAIGIGLVSIVMMLGARVRRGLQPAGGLGPDMPLNMVSALGDNVMEMKPQDSNVKANSSRVGWGQLSSNNSRPQTFCYATKEDMAAHAKSNSDFSWEDEMHTMKSIARRPIAAGAIATLFTLPANALVKGSAPPPKTAKGEKRTCKTIDECEEAGRQREAAMYDAQNQPFQTTKDGVRWRDVREGSGGEVDKGDGVVLKYRVMRLGKRATDNLSGEASPVFSLGYGEDDDTEKDVLEAVVGGKQLIPALDSALVGMRKGGSRRLFVVPEKGWKKINASCSATTNGASNAGDASAGGLDVLGQAVVPLAEIVDNGACIEDTLLPQPRNFGAKRRLARRFDEGLLVEVELVDLKKGG